MRAPWRWRWGRILGLLLLWSGVCLVLRWAPVLSLAVAGWFVLWVRAGVTQPRSPGVDPLSGDEEAGHSVTTLGQGGGVIVKVHAESRRFGVRG